MLHKEGGMKHSAQFGHASQSTYYPRTADWRGDAFSISRIGDTQGDGLFATNFMTPYTWGLLGLRGRAEVSIGGKTHLLEEGAACLFRPDHESRFTEDSANPFRYLWFDMRGTEAERTLDSTLDPTTPLLVRARAPDELRRELLLLRDMLEGDAYSRVTQVAAAWKILDCFCRDLATGPVNLAHSCRVLIETGFLHGITIARIAGELEVSRSTLFRQFREAYGTSPKAYLDELRVDHACSLLAGTNLSVKEIVYSSGFETPQNFHRMFLKHRGVRPTEMRLRNRNDPRIAAADEEA